MALKTYADKDGTCWPSISTLCADLDSSRKTVIADLVELEGFRVLKRTPRKGTTSMLYLLDDEHFAKFLARKSSGGKTPPLTGGKTPLEVEP